VFNTEYKATSASTKEVAICNNWYWDLIILKPIIARLISYSVIIINTMLKTALVA
jgi:hypothetical protein